MALTGKRKAFAEAKSAGKSNKDAALAAGYSAATASAAGSRLVKDKEIVAYLEKLKVAAETGKPVEADGPKFDLGAAMQHKDPRVFLIAAMNDIELAPKLRIDAAKALMPFEHQKLGEGGKKDQQQADAVKVASKFAAGAPPKLAAVGGKKV